jgi:hypothetical protein
MPEGAPRATDPARGVDFRISGQIVETIGHGTYTTEQIAAVFQAVRHDPGFRPPALLLIDLRDSQVHHSFDDVRARLTLIEEQLGALRVAFVVAGDARERLARIYQARATETNRVPVEVFTDPDAAREWLEAALSGPQGEAGRRRID